MSMQPSVKRLSAALLLATLLLSACSSAAPTLMPAPEFPPAPELTTTPAVTLDVTPNDRTVIIGVPQEPQLLNVYLSTQPIADAIAQLVVEGLIAQDDKAQFTPVLATEIPSVANGGVSADGLTVTYKLRQGVKWSNGQDFTCADVVFTWQAARQLSRGANIAGYEAIESIACTDVHTAVLTFERPYAPYLTLFPVILPEGSGAAQDMSAWAYNRAPVGTGPFLLKQWQAGNRLTLVKNPSYRGQVGVEQIIIQIIPSRAAGLQLIKTGALDILWGLTESDLNDLDALAQDGVRYTAQPTGETEFLLFNLADPTLDAPADPVKHPHPQLADLRVRQAIQLGIDKPRLAASLAAKVTPATSILNRGWAACAQPLTEFNPDKARQLLEEAGWLPGPDNIRIKESVKLRLRYQTTADDPLRQQAQSLLVDMMKEIGVDLHSENLPADLFFASWGRDGVRKHGRFDVLQFTSGPSLADPADYLAANFAAESIPTAANKGAGSNYSRWINRDFEARLADAAATLDLGRRQALYCQGLDSISAELPRIVLYNRLLIHAYRTRVQNFSPSPGALDFAYGAQNWTLQ